MNSVGTIGPSYVKHKINKPDSPLIPYTKYNLKWIIDLNIQAKIIKLLEENIKIFVIVG